MGRGGTRPYKIQGRKAHQKVGGFSPWPSRGGAARAGHGAPSQSSHRPAASAGNDHEPKVDCTAVGDGVVDLRLQPAQRESGGFTSPGGPAFVSLVSDTCTCIPRPSTGKPPSPKSSPRAAYRMSRRRAAGPCEANGVIRSEPIPHASVAAPAPGVGAEQAP